MALAPVMAALAAGHLSPASLTTCDWEPIHIPGAIQPHGALFALDGSGLKIEQVSLNVETFLGLRVDEVLGGELSQVLSADSIRWVAQALQNERCTDANPLRLRVGERFFDGIIHRHQGRVLLELEARMPSPAEDVHHLLRPTLVEVQSASTVAGLCRSVVDEVRRLTGFERVVVYQFDADDHGSVEAESRRTELEPYLGLHYPAGDIPRPARELYLRNWLRIIPDARYVPVPLVSRNDLDAPLDLTFSVLRSVSPVHLEYMANMGVRASMSVSLIVKGRLWGLISCSQHSGPHLVPYEQRSACEVLGRLISLQIGALEDGEAATRRSAYSGTQRALASAMRGSDPKREVLSGLLLAPEALQYLVGAEGAAVINGSEVESCGATPPAAFILELSAWLETRSEAGLFSASALAVSFPAASQMGDVASGVMTFALPGLPRRRILWFRPELAQTVRWGGDPRKPTEAGPGMRIHPRRSFNLWREEVRLTSAVWSPSDHAAGEELRRNAVEIDLERQLLRQQQAVRARDELVAVVSHDLKTPLAAIQLQAAIQLRESLNGELESSRRLRAGAERIQRSVDKMNRLLHDLLDLSKIEAGRFVVQTRSEDVQEMAEDALTILRPLAEAKRITLREAFVETQKVLADRDRIFQVLCNLVGNAIKFTPEGGAITLTVQAAGAEVLVSIEDTGAGIHPEQLANIFDRYWQARRPNPSGSGLGLFIAKGIIEAHGGRLWAESPPSFGAKLVFTLPLG